MDTNIGAMSATSEQDLKNTKHPETRGHSSDPVLLLFLVTITTDVTWFVADVTRFCVLRTIPR